MKWTHRVGLGLAGLIGIAFVALGLRLGTAGATALPHDQSTASAALMFLRWFGVRDGFLGALILLLLATREFRALRLMMSAAIALPIIDAAMLAAFWGWDRAIRFNAPYVLVLAVIAALLWVGARAGSKRNAG